MNKSIKVVLWVVGILIVVVIVANLSEDSAQLGANLSTWIILGVVVLGGYLIAKKIKSDREYHEKRE